MNDQGSNEGLLIYNLVFFKSLGSRETQNLVPSQAFGDSVTLHMLLNLLDTFHVS